MTGTMAVCAVAALGVYALVVRPAERRIARVSDARDDVAHDRDSALAAA